MEFVDYAAKNSLDTVDWKDYSEIFNSNAIEQRVAQLDREEVA